MKFYLKQIFFALLITSSFQTNAEKVDENRWWWSDNWWNEGHIEVPQNYSIRTSWTEYESGENTINVFIAKPQKSGKFPAVFFQHGRRGLDELVQRHAKRLAARGFVVFAPDIYNSLFIDSYPLAHDYSLEKHIDAGIDVLLKRKDISTSKVCLYSHTRGGYYTLKVATIFKRQENAAACYISYYPHWQDPNAPEPSQVYGYAPEIDTLTLPTLVFIGENDQYQRRRVIDTSIKVLQDKKRDVRLIVYPGVGRGFDFRPENVRTFADDLASKDAIQRAANFINKHLSAHNK